MFLIRLIYKFFALFQTHATHQGLALGVCAGMMLGLSPIQSLHFWFFISLCFLIRINLACTLTSWVVFAFIAATGKAAFFVIGDYLLNKKSLISVWNGLYELPLIPYTNFYVPQVLGQMVFLTLMCFPIYVCSRKAIQIIEPTIYHWWRTTKLYMIYRGYKPYAR